MTTIEPSEEFNWAAILKDLIAGRPLTTEELTKLYHMASNWNHCACGQLCKDMPRSFYYYDVPQDEDVRKLGVEFCEMIKVEDWSAAMRVFHDIEKRSDALRQGAPIV